MQNLPLTFDYSTYSQKLGEDFAKFLAFSEYMNFNKPVLKTNLNFLFQSMNDPRALRNRVLKYLIPVFIICIVFNITKFFEIDVKYIPINSTNINNTTQRFSTTNLFVTSKNETTNSPIHQFTNSRI